MRSSIVIQYLVIHLPRHVRSSKVIEHLVVPLLRHVRSSKVIEGIFIHSPRHVRSSKVIQVLVIHLLSRSVRSSKSFFRPASLVECNILVRSLARPISTAVMPANLSARSFPQTTACPGTKMKWMFLSFGCFTESNHCLRTKHPFNLHVSVH